MIKMLEESTLPIEKVRLLASARSAGKPFNLKEKRLLSKKQLKLLLKGVDIALFSAGGSTSLSSLHTVKGCVVGDNTFISVKILMFLWLFLRLMHMLWMHIMELSLVQTVQLFK